MEIFQNIWHNQKKNQGDHSEEILPFVAAPVKIPEDIHHILSKFSKSRTLPARQVQRAKIILLAADGMNNM